MITLIVVIYVLFSLYISIQNMRTTYGIFGGEFEAQKPKSAFIEGFLTLPIIAAASCLFLGAAYLLIMAILGVLWVMIWLVENAP